MFSLKNAINYIYLFCILTTTNCSYHFSAVTSDLEKNSRTNEAEIYRLQPGRLSCDGRFETIDCWFGWLHKSNIWSTLKISHLVAVKPTARLFLQSLRGLERMPKPPRLPPPVKHRFRGDIRGEFARPFEFGERPKSGELKRFFSSFIVVSAQKPNC